MNILDQAHLIKQFNDEVKQQFNPALFEKKDEELIQAMANSITSLQRDQSFTIKVVSINVVKDYQEMEQVMRQFISSGKFRRDAFPSLDKIQLVESEYYLMVIKYFIKINKPRGSDTQECEFIDVPILLPKVVNKYYFKIDGKFYSPMYWLYDTSVYNNSDKKKSRKFEPEITIISIFAPIRIRKHSVSMTTTDSDVINMKTFMLINLFSKDISPFNYVAAKLGYFEALSFYGINGIRLTDYPYHNVNDYTFKVSNNKCVEKDLYISVNKYLFDNCEIVQSLVHTIFTTIKTFNFEFEFNDVFSKEFWILSLGFKYSNDPNVEYSLNLLKSLEGILDKDMYNRLRLPPEEKQTIYHVLRWGTREFDRLYEVDRKNIDNKKISWADYIAKLYTRKFNDNIKIASKQIRLKAVRTSVKIKPLHIMNYLKGRFQLTAYRDLVNDLDAITGLKYSIKDPEKKNRKNNIPSEYRDIDISHLGRLDLDSSPKSDPGISGILSPLADVYTDYKYLSQEQEPNGWYEDWEHIENELSNQGITDPFKGITCSNEQDIKIVKEPFLVLKDEIE